MNTLSWGLLATGRIAGIFAKHLSQSKTGRIVAVGSRTQQEADRFGAEFGVPRCHGSYEALLADPDVQAVYISTPHPMHAEWCLKAAAAKKHILCEKPLTLNHTEAETVIEAARKHGVFLMEAFAYRCHPQTEKIVELIRGKAIGEVRVLHASFGFHADYHPEGRLFSNQLGGGSILDVGCYPVSLSRLIAGVAMEKPFAEPIEIGGCAHFTPTRVDSRAIACLKFPGDIIAEIATAIEVQLENSVRIFGSTGNILVPTPWTAGRDGSPTKIFVERNGKSVEEITVESSLPRFALEADYVATHIENRQAPAMTWDDTLGNMKTLDRWRESIGLVYESEKHLTKSS